MSQYKHPTWAMEEWAMKQARYLGKVSLSSLYYYEI